MLNALDGDREKLVIDLSCRRKEDTWFVAMNKWQTITDMEVNEGLFAVVLFAFFLLIFLRIYQVFRTILLGVSYSRSRQRGSAEGHRREVGREAITMV